MEDIFSIGEVSRLLEVPAATIRFWEQEGLISPRRGRTATASMDPGSWPRSQTWFFYAVQGSR